MLLPQYHCQAELTLVLKWPRFSKHWITIKCFCFFCVCGCPSRKIHSSISITISLLRFLDRRKKPPKPLLWENWVQYVLKDVCIDTVYTVVCTFISFQSNISYCHLKSPQQLQASQKYLFHRRRLVDAHSVYLAVSTHCERIAHQQQRACVAH